MGDGWPNRFSALPATNRQGVVNGEALLGVISSYQCNGRTCRKSLHFARLRSKLSTNLLSEKVWIGVRKRLGASVLVIFRRLACICIFCSLMWGQQQPSLWQEDVRKLADAQDWTAAMSIVDREIARAPQDMDVRTWRARILMWAGKLAEAEREYHEILATVTNDPDTWVGLANVYSCEGQTAQALQALDLAVNLDPKRAKRRWNIIARWIWIQPVRRHAQACFLCAANRSTKCGWE